MTNRPPIVLQSYFVTNQIRLTFRLSVLSAAVVFNIACGTTDPTTSPPPSSAESEAASQNPFSPASSGDDSVIPTTTPEQAQDENVDGAPLVTALPELSPAEPIAGSDSAQTPAVTVVSRASCTASESDMQQRALQLINEARKIERNCGEETFSATRALFWNTSLADAARLHSDDMAIHNFFSHTGSNGSTASNRVTSSGYRWRAVGENIAAGRDSAAETVNDWLNSPGHCRNIMNPSYTEVAVTCSEENSSDFRRYWTNVFAAPQ